MQKTPLSIRIIYILTSIVYYISALVCSLGTLLALVILLGFLNDDLQLHVDLPVKINVEEVGEAYFAGERMDVQIVEAKARIHFINTYPKLARRLAIPLTIIFPYLFWIVFLFHRFIRNVREGRTFEIRNFKYLRMLAYSLIGLWFITVIYMQIFNYTIVNTFSFETIELTNEERWYEGILLSGLFTLVLAHVFLKGRQLEEENELTI
ncbi:MAG: DUF2975 domain-containing protein [Bacteroidetes bacterium]|nr:DUF2975 domain-containing protein [Bacteroidota bacterium]